MTATHKPVKRRNTHWQYRIARVDANGHRTTTQFDELWRPAAVTNPLGYATTTLYDALSRPIALVDARGYATTTEYDAVGRVKARTDPLGQIATYTYDPTSFRALGFADDGQLTFAAGGTQHPWTRLDARSRLTTYTLDYLNRPSETLYQDGGEVLRTYDPLGRERVVQDSAGAATTSYDPVGRVLEVVQPTGQRLSYTYDPVGNRRLMQDPDDGITSYAWDANHRLTGIVNPYGEETTISYDALNRELARVASVGVDAYRAYDAAGRQTLLRNVLDNGTVIVYTSTCDAAGNRVRTEEFANVSSPDRQYVSSYVYDDADQLVVEQWESESVVACSFAYDAAGNRTSRVLVGQRTSYTCDAANRLVLVEPVGGDPVTVTYDEAGNVLLINKGGLLTTHVWDSENRLTRIEYSDDTPESYAYSPDGRRRRRTFNPDGNAVVLGGDNVSVELAAGSAPRSIRVLTQVPVPDQPLTVTFDSEASEYRVHLGTNEWGFLDSSKNSAQQVAAALNNTSDLDATALGGALNSVEGSYHLGGWVDFIWDGANVLQEVDSSGETRAHYTDFPGVWGGLASQRREGVSHAFAFDPQGNTRLMLGGSQARSALFWAFGEFKFGWGMDIAVNPYWYGGQFGLATDRVDGSVPGLPQNTRVNARRRQLATEWGRFLSPDPEWPEDGPNWYLYVGNRVPNRTDPSGLGPPDMELFYDIYCSSRVKLPGLGPMPPAHYFLSDAEMVQYKAAQPQLERRFKREMEEARRRLERESQLRIRPPRVPYSGASWAETLVRLEAWKRGDLPSSVRYGQNDEQTKALRGSIGANQMRMDVIQRIRRGEKTGKASTSHWGPLLNTILQPLNATQAWTGGFDYSWRLLPEGKVEYTITNTTSMKSWYFHDWAPLPIHDPEGRLVLVRAASATRRWIQEGRLPPHVMHDLTQEYVWSESIPEEPIIAYP